MHLQPADLQAMSRFYRANLINCLSGHKPVVLVGTANTEGQTNLALFSNIFHMGADPALLGYVQRPVGQSGDSFRNITATSVYTFNFVPHEWLEQAHRTSARFPADQSEFDACNFTAEWVKDLPHPLSKEVRYESGWNLRTRFLIRATAPRWSSVLWRTCLLSPNC